MAGGFARPPGTFGSRLLAFFHAHPVVALALLTPGIPEYLSTSSSLLNAVVDPAFFVLQLAINVGQYTAGALLVREAMIRWRKGWATVFLLGAAYAITEEGLGDNTFFNSNHGSDGVLGVFGHYAGVNWVWATGVLAFHVVYSIGLPIVLLGLALPETRGRSLLGGRGVWVAFAALGLSTATETFLVWSEFHFWMGTPLLVASGAAIAVLVVLARRVPSDGLSPARVRPTGTDREFFAVGFFFFPLAFLWEYGFTSTTIPPALLIGAEVVTFAVLLSQVRRGVGGVGNEPLLVHLAFGFVVWQAVFGVLLTLALPYTLPLVALVFLFFFRLRRAYAPAPAFDPPVRPLDAVPGPPGL